MKRILITGGSGFIGSHIAEYFNGKAEIRILDNLRSGYRRNLDGLDVEFIEGDVRDRAAVARAVEGCDHVFHLAAMVSVPESMFKIEECVDINVNGLLVVLEESAKAGVEKLCFSSSAAIYGDNPVVPKVETMLPEPKSPYAITKYVNELYAENFSRLYGIETIGLRYFNVFGRRQDPSGAYAAVIPKFVQSLMKHESPVINGDGSNSRDFTYIDNVLQANELSLLAEDPAAVNQVYNIACGEQTTLNELFTLLREFLSACDPEIGKIEPIHGPARTGDIPHSLASIGKAASLLGYAPEFDVRRGLKEAVNWYVENL